MPRFLYTALFYFVTPLIWLRLIWRARKQPDYLKHLGERYGFYAKDSSAPANIHWLHTVSVGETRAAEPLITALVENYPTHRVLLTHMTPTGRATGAELMQKYAQKYGERLLQSYLPYDLPSACRRFFAHFKPQIGLLMETELWPNLIFTAHAQKIPVALINARLSPRSQKGYLKISALIQPTLQQLTRVAAQTTADGERLKRIGAQAVHVFGNIKFDVTPAEEKLALGKTWKKSLGTRPILLAASTRDGEEALILAAFLRLNWPELLLVIVPRHPQRFEEIFQQIEKTKLPACRRSQNAFPSAETRIWLGDSMGEMPAYFALADLALMGGTLLPWGGQNLIEASACGCPVLLGEHSFNFAQATEDALACNAACRIIDADDALVKAKALLENQSDLHAMQTAAITFSQAHRGATAKTLALIQEIMAC